MKRRRNTTENWQEACALERKKGSRYNNGSSVNKENNKQAMAMAILTTTTTISTKTPVK